MTVREKERLAKLEEKTDNIVAKLDTVIEKLDLLDERYVTRREYNAIKMVLSGLVLLGTMVATFLLLKK